MAATTKKTPPAAARPMEAGGERSTGVSSSLEVLLEEMEVSSGPDVLTLDMITASSEDLLLGGEVEVRDAVEVRRQGRPESRNGSDGIEDEARCDEDEALPTDPTAEPVEDAIGMEVEVTRKSSSSSELSSPASLPREGRSRGGEWLEMDVGALEVVGDAATTETRERHTPDVDQEEEKCSTPEEGAGEGKQTPEAGSDDERRGPGRKREMFIPPVTEWRDHLDSQDILMEFAKHRENSDKGRKGEGGEEIQEEGGGEERHMEEDEGGGENAEEQGEGDGTVGEGEEGDKEAGRREEEGAGEVGGVEQGGHEPVKEKGDEEIVEGELENRGATEPGGHQTPQPSPPSQSELFLPPHSQLYRCLPRAPPVDCDLEVAEKFLEQEERLLRKAKWFPAKTTNSRKLRESRPSLPQRQSVEVSRQDTARHRHQSPAEAAPAINTPSRAEAAPVISTPSRVEAAPVISTASRVEAAPVISTASRAEDAPVISTASRAEDAPVISTASRAEDATVISTASRAEDAPVISTASRAEDSPVISTASRSEDAPVISTVSRLTAPPVTQTVASGSNSNRPALTTFSSSENTWHIAPRMHTTTVNKEQARGNVFELSTREPNPLLTEKLKTKPHPKPRENRTQSPQSMRETVKPRESRVCGGSPLGGGRDEDIDNSFFDRESQMDVSRGEEEGEGPRVTLCSPSTQGSNSNNEGEQQGVEHRHTSQGPTISDRDDTLTPVKESCTAERGDISTPVEGNRSSSVDERNQQQQTADVNRLQAAVRDPSNEKERISSPVKDRNLQQPTTILQTSVRPLVTLTPSPTASPGQVAAPVNDLASCLVIASVTSERCKLEGLTLPVNTLEQMQDTSDSGTAGEQRVEGGRVSEEEDGERRDRGREERALPVNTTAPRLPPPDHAHSSRTLRCPDADVTDILSDLRLSLTEPQPHESWSKFHDFVLRLPLPLLSDVASTSTSNTRRGRKRRGRERTPESSREPLSEEPLPSTSGVTTNSLHTQLKEEPMDSAPDGEGSEVVETMDHLSHCPPPQVISAGASVATGDAATVRGGGAQTVCSGNGFLLARGNQLHNRHSDNDDHSQVN